MAYSPTAIKVTWKLLSGSQGTISGFKLHIKENDASRSPEKLFEEFMLIQNASQTSIIIRNLSIFTTYQIRMAAYNRRGVGNYSDPVLAGKKIFLASAKGETCCL